MRRLIATVSVLMLLVSCSGDASESGRYQLGEFFISGPARLSDETESVTLENVGEFPHTLVVTRPSGQVVAASGLVQPDETITLDLTLEPGTYQFTCRIVGQDSEGQLVDHYERGMHATVSVGG